jgi:hypothetical protein
MGRLVDGCVRKETLITDERAFSNRNELDSPERRAIETGQQR